MFILNKVSIHMMRGIEIRVFIEYQKFFTFFIIADLHWNIDSMKNIFRSIFIK